MVEVELWDGTKAEPKPIARLEVSEDGVKILAGRGKVRVDSHTIHHMERGNSTKVWMVYVTNLSMDIYDEFYPAHPMGGTKHTGGNNGE